MRVILMKTEGKKMQTAINTTTTTKKKSVNKRRQGDTIDDQSNTHKKVIRRQKKTLTKATIKTRKDGRSRNTDTRERRERNGEQPDVSSQSNNKNN